MALGLVALLQGCVTEQAWTGNEAVFSVYQVPSRYSKILRSIPEKSEATLSVHYQRIVPYIDEVYLHQRNRYGPGIEIHSSNQIVVFTDKGEPIVRTITKDELSSLQREWREIGLMEHDKKLFHYQRPAPEGSMAPYDSWTLVIVDRSVIPAKVLVVSSPKSFMIDFDDTPEGQALIEAVRFIEKCGYKRPSDYCEKQ